MKPVCRQCLLPAAFLSIPLTLLALTVSELQVTNYMTISSGAGGVGNQSLAVGYNHFISAANSAAIGSTLQVYQANALAAGMYNNINNALLVVGRGNSHTDRLDALAVAADGTVTIPGTATIGALTVKGGLPSFSGGLPVWWSGAAFGFLKSPAGPGNDSSPANAGQLKYAASRAKLYLDSRLAAAGGAGEAISAMCQFSNGDNFAPLQVGQLKNVAAVFYDRLARIGYNWQTKSQGIASTPYPWTGTTNASNAAPATVGQLKKALNFEITDAFLSADGDGDGIPSWWESAYGLNPALSDAAADNDFDQLLNGEEYAMFAAHGLVSSPVSGFSSQDYGGLSDYEVSLVKNDGYTQPEVKKLRNGDSHVLREEPTLRSYSIGVSAWQNSTSGLDQDKTKHLEWVYAPPSVPSTDPAYQTTGPGELRTMAGALPDWPSPVDETRVAIGPGAIAFYDGSVSGPAVEPFVVDSKTRAGSLTNVRTWMRAPRGTNFTVTRRLYCLSRTKSSTTPDPLWNTAYSLKEVSYVIPASGECGGPECASVDSNFFDLQPEIMNNDGYFFQQGTFVLVGSCDLFASEPRVINPPTNTPWHEFPITADDSGNIVIPIRPNSDNDLQSYPVKADIDSNRAAVSATGRLSAAALSSDNDLTRLHINNSLLESDFELTVATGGDPGTKLFLYDSTGKAITPEELHYVTSQPAPMPQGVRDLLSPSLGIFAETGQLATAGGTLPPIGKATITFTIKFGGGSLASGITTTAATLTKTATFVPIKLEWEEVPYFDNFGDNVSPEPLIFFGMIKKDNWLPGRGKRIIVDSKTPNGLRRNKVKLKITKYTSTSPSLIYLKIFDVDDPYPTNASYSTFLDPTGSGGDNFGGEPNRPAVSGFNFIPQSGLNAQQIQYHKDEYPRQVGLIATLTLPASGEMSIELATTIQPGDNFRAMASSDQAQLNSIQIYNESENLYLGAGNTEISGNSGNITVSPMLTVWRQLSIEIDSMPAPPPLLSAPDNVVFAQAVWLGSNNSNKISIINNPSLSDKNDFYEGGYIKLNNNIKLEIIHNYQDGNKCILEIDHPLTPPEIAALNSGGVVLDDDWRYLPNALSNLLPHNDFLSDPLTKNLSISKYLASYILIRKYPGINDMKLGDWNQNHTPYSPNNGFTNKKQIDSSPYFWAAHLGFGYQPVVDEDGDPNNENSTLGTTDDEQHLSMVYLEAILDGAISQNLAVSDENVRRFAQITFRNMVALTALHELGHIPRFSADVSTYWPAYVWNPHYYLEHDEKGIMMDNPVDLEGGVFTPMSIKRFRRTSHWEGAPPE